MRNITAVNFVYFYTIMTKNVGQPEAIVQLEQLLIKFV